MANPKDNKKKPVQGKQKPVQAKKKVEQKKKEEEGVNWGKVRYNKLRKFS